MISADRDAGTPAVKLELKRLATALARALFRELYTCLPRHLFVVIIAAIFLA
jgi:hypothetical protein